jgi:hypothetical protein
LTLGKNKSSASVNSNLISEEEANYKGFRPSSKEEVQNNNIKEYTEVLTRCEWKFNFKEYREEEREGKMGSKTINQTHSGNQKRAS